MSATDEPLVLRESLTGPWLIARVWFTLRPPMAEYPNDIRYVCLSDIHLGEEDSLLTCLADDGFHCAPDRVSPTLARLVDCLRDIVAKNEGTKKPTLILAGDILDLAFATFSQSLMTFERVLELIIKPGEEIFDKVVYIPGNHDHHVWEMARETQYVHGLKQHLHDKLPDPCHVSPLFEPTPTPSYLLNQIARHVRGQEPGTVLEYPVHVAYPNHGAISDDGERCVIFSHGHYAESHYWLISKLRRWLFPNRPLPETVEQLEAENFAWVDFVWSLLGRSGAAGTEVEHLYKRLQFATNREKFAERLAARIVDTVDIPLIPGNWLEKKVLKSIFSRIAQITGGERTREDVCVSHEVAEGLGVFLFGPTFRQIEDEVGKIPKELAFIFGHTHKPYQTTMHHPDTKQPVDVYNSGGWTVDSVQPRPHNGGAVVLVSNDLRVASLRMYNESTEAVTTAIRIAQAPDAPAGSTAFLQAMQQRLATNGTSVWSDFSKQAGDAITTRRNHMTEHYLD